MTRNVILYTRVMGRWQSGARERLERAALELFLEQGFAETTVPEITARAGLTTRTFLSSLRRQAGGALRGRGGTSRAGREAYGRRPGFAWPNDGDR